jgi:anaerobic dimethyl sulfoxide reductase subunit C (anchor subunit)
MLKEWPLVAFTVAGQMAVGVFLFTGVPLFLLPGAGADLVGRETGLVVLAVVFGLLTVAALLSLFHLHHPLRARRVLTNLQTSWLSREIFFELGFMALVALGLVLAWRQPAGGHLLKGIVAGAGLAGILFILSMSKLYMLQTIPPWNRAYTPLSFFLTSLSLGALAAALVMGAGGRKPSQAALFILLSFILVAADVTVAFFIAPGHGVFGHRPGPSLRPPGEAHLTLHLARLALLLTGLALIRGAMIAGEGRASGGLRGKGLLTVALALVLAGQVAGRFLFYGLFGRPGR